MNHDDYSLPSGGECIAVSCRWTALFIVGNKCVCLLFPSMPADFILSVKLRAIPHCENTKQKVHVQVLEGRDAVPEQRENIEVWIP